MAALRQPGTENRPENPGLLIPRNHEAERTLLELESIRGNEKSGFDRALGLARQSRISCRPKYRQITYSVAHGSQMDVPAARKSQQSSIQLAPRRCTEAVRNSQGRKMKWQWIPGHP